MKRLGLIIVSITISIVLAGVGVAVSKAIDAGNEARAIAATERADQQANKAGQSQIDYASCLRANRIADGLLSLVDGRAPSRKSANLVLSNPASTDVQRLSARTTLRGLDGLKALLEPRLRLETCFPPEKVKP